MMPMPPFLMRSALNFILFVPIWSNRRFVLVHGSGLVRVRGGASSINFFNRTRVGNFREIFLSFVYMLVWMGLCIGFFHELFYFIVNLKVNVCKGVIAWIRYMLVYN